MAILIFLFIIYKLKEARKYLPTINIASSFREQLTQRKLLMQHQKDLLNSVPYWYVLPPFIMNVIFIFGLGDPEAYKWSTWLAEALPNSLKEKIFTITFLGVFYSFVIWLNKRAVKRELQPVIDHIEEVQKQLENGVG